MRQVFCGWGVATDAVTEADKDYTVFDGWEKDTDGSVKFIIETAAIK